MKKQFNAENNTSLLIVFAVVTLLLAAFFYALPFSMDDWKWGSEVGMQRLSEHFKDYNGRYLGNITVILATRSAVFRVALMTCVTQLLCVQVAKMATSRVTATHYMLSVALIFCTVLPAFVSARLNLFSQTIGWASGFSNYVVPMVFVLAYALNLKKYYLNRDLKSTRLECVAMLLCGVCSCLFLETITIFCVASCFVINLLFYAKRKKIYSSQISFFAGSAVGTALMLSNSSYLNMLKGFLNKSGFGSEDRAIGFVSKSVFDEFTVKMGMSPKLLIIIFLIMIVVLLALLVLPFLVTKQKNKRLLLLASALAVITLTLPLLFANGGHNYIISIRVYFPQYVFAVIYLVTLVDIMVNSKGDKAQRLLKSASAIMLCAALAVCVYGYAPLCKAYSASDKYVREQVKSKAEAVEVIKYPEKYSRFMFMADVLEYDEEWIQAYKEYYHIDNNTKLVLIDYKEYLQSKQV